MNAPLDYYRSEFRSLSGRDRSGEYEGRALEGAPHQPMVLLMILDLYALDPLRHNLIEPDSLLRELWVIYKGLLDIPGSSPLVMPLYALRSASFWHLVLRPGRARPAGRVRNLKGFYAHFVGIVLDSALHELLRVEANRNQLRNEIIKTYFPKERWFHFADAPASLRGPTFANSAFTGRLLGDPTFGKSSKQAKEGVKDRILRDAGFRKVVTHAYGRRCAFCGVRLQTTLGHVVVEAAHIHPWAESHDDRPVNGLCLCPLCHWAFDKRMIAVDLKLQILTHNRIQSHGNVPGHLATLEGRGMFRPSEDRFLPDPVCVSEQLKRFHASS